MRSKALLLFSVFLFPAEVHAGSYWWCRVPGRPEQMALYDGNEQVGGYLFSEKAFYARDVTSAGKIVWDEKPSQCPCEPPAPDGAVEALDEVNAKRARLGLPPYIRDPGLTTAALAAASFRAEKLIQGHTSNDFAFLPPGSTAPAAGCGALDDSWGWQSCCDDDRQWIYAGAAWCRGQDGRRYMHLFVR